MLSLRHRLVGGVLGNRPDLAPSPSELNRVLPPGGKTETVGEGTRNYDKRRSGVDQKLDILAVTARADKTSGNAT